MIKVILVDDHSVLRSGLKMLLNAENDLEVIGEAGCGEDALKLLEVITPDVLVLDLSMPGMGGLATLKQVKETYPMVKVLILTMHDDEKYLPSVLEAGAGGYVVKKSVDSVVITAIRTVASGQPYLDSTMTGALISGLIKQNNPYQSQQKEKIAAKILSPRELEVIKLIALGHTNKQIAVELVISVKTVEAHKSKIKEKLNISKRSDLVRYAMEQGLI
jgi:two-component system response regulator NreC